MVVLEEGPRRHRRHPDAPFDCTEQGARLPNILGHLRREMKGLSKEEEDPDVIRTGRTLKVPPHCSVLLIWSGNQIRAEGHNPCVEHSRRSQERVDCVGQLVALLKAWDRSLFVVSQR